MGRVGFGLQRRVPPHLADRDAAQIWDLGEPLTARDAAARTFDGVFTLDTPRDPKTWATPAAGPVPSWTVDPEVVGRAVSGLGKGVVPGLVAHAKSRGIALPPEAEDPDGLVPRAVVDLLRVLGHHYFPALAP